MSIQFSKRLHSMLETARATSSRNSKLKIITDYTNSLRKNSIDEFNTFKLLCQCVFDYQKTYNIQKIPDYFYVGGHFSIDHHIRHGIIPLLINKNISGNMAKDMLANSLSNSDCYETEQLLKCIINKSFDIGADLNTFTKAFGEELVREHEVSLCSPGTQKLIEEFEYPCFGQLKYDAMRIEVDTNSGKVPTLITRPGKSLFTNNPDLDQALLLPLKSVKTVYAKYGYIIEGSRTHIDGEMVFLDKQGKKLSRQVSNGIANKVLKGTKDYIETDEIIFCVWDIITPEEKLGKLKIPYNIRLKILNDLCGNNKAYEVAETVIINNKEEAIALAISYINRGLEGCIIKTFNMPWSGKRVKTQIKLKAARECELRIVGFNIANDNKYHGLIGSLECVSEDGIVSANISGLSDAERSDLLDDKVIGTIITVRYNEMLANKKDSNRFSLFLPRMIERRLDKTRADTYKEILNSEFIVFA